MSDVICVLETGALKLDALIVQFPTLRFAFYNRAGFVLGTTNSNALYKTTAHCGVGRGRRHLFPK